MATEKKTMTRQVAKKKAAALGHDLGKFSKVDSGYGFTAYYRAACHSCGLLAIAEETFRPEIPRRATELKCSAWFVKPIQ